MLHAARTSGSQAVRLKGRRGEDAMPRRVAPMLALSSDLPPDPANWAFEYKWDGVRAICYWDGKSLQLHSRNLLDITSSYPELSETINTLGKHRAILDGEIVALDAQGRPSFARLQRRMHVGNPSAELRKSHPIIFVVFDLLYLDGHWIGDQPQQQRRQQLESLGIAGRYWQITPSHAGEGAAMLKAAAANALEGLVAKRLDSVYQQGRRSPDWRKIKITQRQEMVIGGWIPEKGESDSRRIGALLMGYYDAEGKLRYAGSVGTGFNAAEHQRLWQKLLPRVHKNSSFADPTPKAGARFVAPELVAEIEYRRWPQGGLIQHAAYKGLRADKPARQVLKDLVIGSEA